MYIDRVTITGADDLVNVHDLVALHARFPFVEFGILFESDKFKPRYPSDKWISCLIEHELPLSAHLCGPDVQYPSLWMEDRLPSWVLSRFRRIQLNVDSDVYEEMDFPRIWESWVSFGITTQRIILQCRTGFSRCNEIAACNRAISRFDLMHDGSAGRGIRSPWEEHPGFSELPCGYAGGITPENIVCALEELDTLCSTDTHIWIDMETGVRENHVLSPEKAAACLAAASMYTNGGIS